MTLALCAVGIISLLELALYLPGVWHTRRLAGLIVLLLLAIASGALFASRMSVLNGVILIASFYRLFSLIRIIEGRMQEQYLRRVAFRTSYSLIAFQLIVLGVWWALNALQFDAYVGWLVLSSTAAVVGVLLLASTVRHARTTIPVGATVAYALRDLPSITVCVPARNETESLEDCLQALVASDYPKLEILVLDDCSQDRTSEIIRSFAHDGVRFVKGIEPSGDWLAKNWAYEQLYKEANGSILVFCGVDVRFEPATLRNLISTMREKNKSMICVMPKNLQVKKLALFIQPMRYAWELSLPRRLFNRPPVLSSCWAIDRHLLKKAGSFAAVSTMVTPESHLAGVAIQHDGYSFLRSTQDLAVGSVKSTSEQWETATRTKYPQLHRKPELVFMLSAIELLLLVTPFALVVVTLCLQQWLLAGIAAVAAVALLIMYSLIMKLTYHRSIWYGVWIFPFAVLLDIFARHDSMWQYEFSEVVWKGRNICLPVMHVVPRLPLI